MGYFMVRSWQFPGWTGVNHKIWECTGLVPKGKSFLWWSSSPSSFFYPFKSSHSICCNKSLYNENCCLCKLRSNLGRIMPGQFVTWTFNLLCYYLIKLWHMKLSSNPLIVNLQLSKYSSLHFSTEKTFSKLYINYKYQFSLKICVTHNW